ncbi:MAG: sigma-70 family RNA polymerase sigma factor [Erysipelotrichaceae bacterium]|nr:sigma-70 family RNA polymerase sigma factor [Erysipelotrichaceae bacterium]
MWKTFNIFKDFLKNRYGISLMHNGAMEVNIKLLERVREGDDEAFRALLDEHRLMIYKIINSFNLNSGDFKVDENDLFQEGCLALYDSAFTYEEKHNVKFSSYAYMNIRSRIVGVLRNCFRTYSEEGYSLDNGRDRYQRFCVHDDPVNYHREIQFKEELDRFIRSLDSQDQMLLKLKNDDCSYKQIAQILDISVKRVDNRLRTLRNRLRRHMEQANSAKEKEK